MSNFQWFLVSAAATFIFCLLLVPTVLGIARLLGLYTIVEERRCQVYVLFGKTARDVDCPLKLFRRDVWERTAIEPRGADRWFSTRLVVRARRLGFGVAELPVRRRKRPRSPTLGESAENPPSASAAERVA